MGATYHPAVAALPIHDPSCNLASSLDDEETAKALGDLEGRCAVPERLVPSADGEVLQQPLRPKDPLLHRLVV